MAASKEPIIAALQKAYNMELETVTNYLAERILETAGKSN